MKGAARRKEMENHKNVTAIYKFRAHRLSLFALPRHGAENETHVCDLRTWFGVEKRKRASGFRGANGVN